MSAYASWHVDCDECGEEMSAMDQGCRTAREARDEARDHGGHRSKGRDICEDCWLAGVR